MKGTRRQDRPIKEVALSLLARRDHTSVELRRKLRSRGYGQEEVETVLLHLGAMGLVDDRRTARLLVEHELARRAAGPALVRAKLAAKGVAPGLADECLAALHEDWETDQARRAASKWLKRHPGHPVEREALARHLRSRGFGWETVRTIVDSLPGGHEEWRDIPHEEP